MSVESITQSLSNLALSFGKMDVSKGGMVNLIRLFTFTLIIYKKSMIFCFEKFCYWRKFAVFSY